MIAGSRKPFFVSPSKVGSRSGSAFKTRSAKLVDFAGARSTNSFDALRCGDLRSGHGIMFCNPVVPAYIGQHPRRRLHFRVAERAALQRERILAPELHVPVFVHMGSRPGSLAGDGAVGKGEGE